jgi:quercetin dioxygenase-like cupin family protein
MVNARLGVVLLGVALAGVVWALDKEQVVVVTQDRLTWGPGPASLPAGAQAAMLEGDLAKPGPFTVRIRVPKGWTVMPHYHPAVEHVTILQGSAKVGMGDKLDLGRATALPAGAFFAMPAKHHHFFAANEDSVVQLHGIGPWDIIYLNPADDPRKAKAGAPTRTPMAQ